MINFLEETLEAIKNSGHSVEDVVYIGSDESEHSCSWDEFAAMADHEYDNGYGAPIVAVDLIIVFSDQVKLRRGEFRGQEWWSCELPFELPDSKHKIKNLFADGEIVIGWAQLSRINEEQISS